MIRATTGGVLKSYRSNLMNSFISMNKARDTVLTQRNFNSYAEDPTAAAKAFRLRKSRMEVGAQYDICSDTYKKFQSAWSCLDTIDDILDTETASPMNTISGTTLKMLNDPTGDARTQLSKALDQMSQSIVQTLNQKYGDTFLFAGADGHNVPFEVKDDGKLYYRNVPVDAAVPKLMTDDNGDALRVNAANGQIDPAGEDYVSANAKLVEVPKLVTAGGGNVMVDETGQVDAGGTNYLLDDTPRLEQAGYDAAIAAGEDADNFSSYTDGGTTWYFRKAQAVTMSQDEYQKIVDNAMPATDGNPYIHSVTNEDGSTSDYYIVQNEDSVISQKDYDTAVNDAEKLDYLMNKEKLFVDIGLGFQENENGELIQSSGFNAALNGLTFVGYGLDSDGDPKNIYSIVQKLREIADSVPDGDQWPKEVYDEFDALVSKLERASSNFKTEYTNMDAGTTKLKNNLALLEDNYYNLQEQYSDLEYVDMVDSITSFIWAQYCYNAALKVGNNVLSESLMDYLN